MSGSLPQGAALPAPLMDGQQRLNVGAPGLSWPEGGISRVRCAQPAGEGKVWLTQARGCSSALSSKAQRDQHLTGLIHRFYFLWKRWRMRNSRGTSSVSPSVLGEKEVAPALLVGWVRPQLAGNWFMWPPLRTCGNMTEMLQHSQICPFAALHKFTSGIFVLTA